MITIERYKNALQDFANMDLGTSRVAFSREEIIIQGEHKWVTVPKIEQKTYKIIQLIQRIFSRIFGYLFYLDSNRAATALKISRLTEDVIYLFRGEYDPDETRYNLLNDAQLGFDLKKEVTQVAWNVLQKIKPACHSEQLRNRIQQMQSDIRSRFSRTVERAREQDERSEKYRRTVATINANFSTAIAYLRSRERAEAQG
ncbi:MAG: hypothetical protein PVI40_07920 [Chlamydiota bacterium]|jgi:hypothetical protein